MGFFSLARSDDDGKKSSERGFFHLMKQNKNLFVAILVILSAMFLYSAADIASYLLDSAQTEQKNMEYQLIYQEIIEAEAYTTPEQTQSYSSPTPDTSGRPGLSGVNGGENPAPNPEPASETPKVAATIRNWFPEPPEGADKFAFFSALNSDFAAFLVIPGTSVALPVVQGADNEYYLSHGFEKQKLRAGTVFIDFHNSSLDAPDKNTVLYGHNMKDGSMFSSVTRYRSRSFWQSAPVIVLDTPYGTQKWEIFAAYTAPNTSHYNQTSFSSDEEFAQFLRGITERSVIRTGITPDTSDVILTLSTCTYDYADARFAVHARLVSD